MLWKLRELHERRKTVERREEGGGRREERERAKTVIIYAHMSKYIVSVFYAVSKCLFLLEIGDFSVIFEKKQRVQRL